MYQYWRWHTQKAFTFLKWICCYLQPIDYIDFTKQLNLQEFIDIKRFGSFRKLNRVLSWVFRFFNNLKQKLLRKPMLLKEILDKKELNLSEEILILDDQNKFETGSQYFRNLKNDLNVYQRK